MVRMIGRISSARRIRRRATMASIFLAGALSVGTGSLEFSVADESRCPVSDEELRRKIELDSLKAEVDRLYKETRVAERRYWKLVGRDEGIPDSKNNIRMFQKIKDTKAEISYTKLYGYGKGKGYDNYQIGTGDWKYEFSRSEYEKYSKYTLEDPQRIAHEIVIKICDWLIQKEEAKIEKLKNIKGDTKEALDARSYAHKELKIAEDKLQKARDIDEKDVWVGKWKFKLTIDQVGKTAEFGLQIRRIGDKYSIHSDVPFDATIVQMTKSNIVFKFSDPLVSSYNLSLTGPNAVQGKLSLAEHPPTGTVVGHRVCVTEIGPTTE